MTNDELAVKLINKQFEMIGEKVKFEDIPDDGIIIVKKKKMQWYNHYKFAGEEQYLEWRNWALKEIDGMADTKWLEEVDLKYGLSYRYKKEGELF